MILQGTNIVIWGRNAAVGTAMEELYQGDQALDWPAVLTSSGSTLDVSSSSADDAPADTGALTMLIYGLGADFKFQTETITLNGQTVVTGTKLWTDVWGLECATFGSGLTNAGDIYAVKTGTGGTYTNGVPGTVTGLVGKILAGWNSTCNGHWTAPDSGERFKLSYIKASAYTQAAVLFVVKRSPWGTDSSRHIRDIIGMGNQGYVFCDMEKLNIEIAPKESIELRVLGAAASAVVQATMALRRI